MNAGNTVRRTDPVPAEHISNDVADGAVLTPRELL